MSTTARYNARKTAAVKTAKRTCANHATMEANPRPPATPESTEATSATASLPHEERVAPRTPGSCGRS